MEEDTKFVKVVVVEPIEIRCAECNEPIGITVEKLESSVYCEDCHSTMKDKIDELEDSINKIRELTEV